MLASVIAALEAVCRADAPLAGFFAGEREIVVARAPGRLDVMGGIADYSGSLVLELPLAEAAIVAVQRHSEPSVAVTSFAPDGSGPPRSVEVPIGVLERGHAEARAWFGADPAREFAAYLAGTVADLVATRGVSLEHEGLRLLLLSTVPEGSGVGSSAAITVAAMVAVCGALALEIPAVELALACQRVENLVVGAPSGVMDPMTATLGEEGKLLELLCQPAEVRGLLAIPETIELFGIDSRVSHHVTGAEYGTVRAAAFMGRRLLEERLGTTIPHLATLGSAGLAPWVDALPVELAGSEFIDRHGQTDDAVTRVEPARRYPVRAATRHPVEEHERVTTFARTLRGELGQAELERLGALMLRSHASYGACGLGSPATDRLVELVSAAGPSRGLFGAKITGGGSGGTVAVLARRGAREEVERVARIYATETGRQPRLFAGSSGGAVRFGAFGVRLGTPGARPVPVFVV